VRLITNPGSNLTPELIARYRILVLPQHIVVDGVVHDTRTSPTHGTVEQWVRDAKRWPETVGTTAAESIAGFQQSVREGDTVSRHGGDEFVVLLAELHQPGDARAVAEKLVATVGAPFDVAGRVVRVSASIGVAVSPDDGEDVDHLIARADAAMYRSKRQHAGGIAFFGQPEGDAPAPHGAPDAQTPAAASGPASAGIRAVAAIHADRRHWCFRAPDRAAVDAFHAAGVAQGGADDGAPGLRPHYHAHYYAAFLLDPDANRVEAVCHNSIRAAAVAQDEGTA
jgi:catechol 2,3-dioxygenase-like lactoylglutathione lyase family enzyme